MSKKTYNQGECRVPVCKKPAKTLGFCNACYARTYYWHKKSLKEKMERIDQIQVWENSLELQVDSPGIYDREKLKKEGK